MSRATAVLQAGDSSEVSGANRPRDTDSGYASMPKNNGDTDDVPPAGKLPAQPGTYLTHVPHDAGRYEVAGSLDVMASPGHITNDEGFDDSFRSIGDHMVQGCFGGYDDPDSLLYGDMSSSTTREDPLLELNLSPAAETTREPLGPWDYSDIDPVFSVI